MSYRNPKQVIDTQSGQYIRDMMKTVTGATINVLKTQQAELKKREKENVERQQRINAEQGRYANAVNAADIKNSGTDWSPTLEKALKRHAALIAKRNDDPLNWSTMDAKELSYWQTLPTTIKTQSVQTEAKMQTYNDAMVKPVGQYGALDKFADPKEYEQINIEGQVGLTGGKSIGDAYFDRELGIGNAKVTSYRLDGKEIGTDANRDFDPPIVPDPTKEFQAISVKLKKAGIQENKYKKNANGTRVVEIKRGTTEEGKGFSQETNPVDIEYLMKVVRAETDPYVYSLGPQKAIRLVNNKALDLKDAIPGMGMLGKAGNIVDPNKSIWIKNNQGEIIDPELERTYIAIARLYIKEYNLDQPNFGKKTEDKIVPTVEKTSFQKAIDKLAPKIKVSAKDTWVLKGTGDDRYYELPAPRDSKGMLIPGGKAQQVKVFLFDEDGKKIGKNILGMRSEMVSVKDNN